MADIPVPFVGGGGDGSDECTATASDVLESKTAIYDGSGDEPAYGSMKDYSGTTSQGSSSLDESNSRFMLTVPNTGKYDTNAKLYNTFSNIRSLIGLSASIIARGNTILGVTGTALLYTGRSSTFVLSTDGHSRSTWVNESGMETTCRSILLSDLTDDQSLGFTPRALFAFTDDNYHAVYASERGFNLIGTGSVLGYFPAESNEAYSFSEDNINVPLDWSSSEAGEECWYAVLGWL